MDGLSTPVAVSGGKTVKMGDIPVQQWHTNIYTRTFFDANGDGVFDPSQEAGLALVATNNRFRDGSFSNFNNTDLNGYASFNEIFPLFNWYVIESDSTRYKSTGVHVVYDAGGPADGTPGNSGSGSTIGQNFANTSETNHLPSNLRIPGAVYCDNADCKGFSIANGRGRTRPILRRAASILHGLRPKRGRDTLAKTSSLNSERNRLRLERTAESAAK